MKKYRPTGSTLNGKGVPWTLVVPNLNLATCEVMTGCVGGGTLGEQKH